MDKIKTYISKALWCDSRGTYKPAEMPLMRKYEGSYKSNEEEDKEIYWLDVLLKGGLVLPSTSEDEKRALTVLIKGPPGTGKSTLAMELCHKWALNENKSSLYLTSETNSELAVHKAESLGWESASDIICRYENVDDKKTGDRNIVKILQTKDFKEYFKNIQSSSLSKANIVSLFGGAILKYDIKGLGQEFIDKRINSRIDDLIRISHDSDIFVIDSLNVVDPGIQGEYYNRFMKVVTAGPKIIITVLESDKGQFCADFWEYFSDVVINLDWKETSNYKTRTIEIVKARFQDHIHGAHQLKILTSPDISGERPLEKKKLDHPYRKEGGIFIYPSIHSYLSIYKRSSVERTKDLFKTPIKSFNLMLYDGAAPEKENYSKEVVPGDEGGFPKGRCIGFIGERGKHKSHLAYLCGLSQVLNGEKDCNGKMLVVSLRDDVDLVRKTMNSILKEELGSDRSVEYFEENDKVEILYFMPGYIRPEEFYHRMFMSVQRLKYGDDIKSPCDVTVVFNSLDYLHSYFPLCTNEDIFIPGIISTLSHENITSFFISVDDTYQPHGHYGLSSMSEALLYFNDEKHKTKYLIKQMKHHFDFEEMKDEKNLLKEYAKNWEDTMSVTVMRVKRIAGGHEAGVGGMLELVKKGTDKFKLFGKAGLNFVPFKQ